MDILCHSEKFPLCPIPVQVRCGNIGYKVLFCIFLIHWLFTVAIITFPNFKLYLLWMCLTYLVFFSIGPHINQCPLQFSFAHTITILPQTFFLTEVNICYHAYQKEHTSTLFCLQNGWFQMPKKYFLSLFLSYSFSIFSFSIWITLCFGAYTVWMLHYSGDIFCSPAVRFPPRQNLRWFIWSRSYFKGQYYARSHSICLLWSFNPKGQAAALSASCYKSTCMSSS